MAIINFIEFMSVYMTADETFQLTTAVNLSDVEIDFVGVNT